MILGGSCGGVAAVVFSGDATLALRLTPERSRGQTRGAMESAHEIRQIAKTNIVSNIGHGLFAAGKKPRGTAQSRTNKILMRGGTDDPGKKA